MACLKAFRVFLSFMTARTIVACLSVIVLASCTTSKYISPTAEIKQKRVDEIFLANLLAQYPQYFDTLLKNNDQWHIKIIYTRIDRKANNEPVLTNYYFNPNPAEY